MIPITVNIIKSCGVRTELRLLSDTEPGSLISWVDKVFVALKQLRNLCVYSWPGDRVWP